MLKSNYIINSFLELSYLEKIILFVNQRLIFWVNKKKKTISLQD